MSLRILVFSFVLYSGIGLCCSAQSSAAVHAYIERFRDAAIQAEREYGIPASITLAQGILESGAGRSELTRKSNNHFGIKAGSGWNGRVHLAQDDEIGKSRFRCYDSAAESYRDHSRLLTSQRYRHLLSVSVYDYRRWAHGLKKAGYATAPDYAQALIGFIEHYRLYAINGGVKLRPGKKAVIVRYVEREKPVFDEDIVVPDGEVTEEEEAVAEAERRYVVEINDVHCTLLQPGETLANVSRRYDIPQKKLLEYNDLSTDRHLKVGDVVFLDRKRKRYGGPRDVYVAVEGESLHDVSQMFGVRLCELARLNDMNYYVCLDAGTRIYLK